MLPSLMKVRIGGKMREERRTVGRNVVAHCSCCDTRVGCAVVTGYEEGRACYSGCESCECAERKLHFCLESIERII
jgi:hypothetical protein